MLVSCTRCHSYDAARGVPLNKVGRFTLPGNTFSREAWGGLWDNHGAPVLVVAPDGATARQMFRSLGRITIADANGCPAQATASAKLTETHPGQASVCRYSADGWLEQSELLSKADTVEAEMAIVAAPISNKRCFVRNDPAQVVLLRFGGADLGAVKVVWDSPCKAARGVFASGYVRQLTSDVLYWALSPGWSGEIPDGVPMPSTMRR